MNTKNVRGLLWQVQTENNSVVLVETLQDQLDCSGKSQTICIYPAMTQDSQAKLIQLLSEMIKMLYHHF